MQELNHETSEALEGPWYSNGRTDFNKHAFSGGNVNLESSSFVHGRIKKRKKALN